MAHKDMENKIRHAFEAVTPDVLDNVLQNCHEQKGTVIPMKKKQTRKWVPLTAAAAALALVLGLGLGFGLYQNSQEVATVVSLDVNPSIELHANAKNKIVKAEALNADGEKILKNLDLKGKDLDASVGTVLDAIIQEGYLNESANSVLVSVDSGDEAQSQQLQKKLVEKVNKTMEDKKFNGSVMSQTVKRSDELVELAEEHDISLGKAKLINRILAQNTTYTFEELAKLSINELNLLTESGKLHLDNVTSTGSASEKKYIGTDSAKAKALEHANVAETDISNLEIDLDIERGHMVYEVEFDTAEFEYEYNINALTGEVLWTEKMPLREGNEPPALPEDAKLITEDEAKAAVLAHAGVTEVTEYTCELDRDHGKLIYEIEFVSGETEYEYNVDALTGKILIHQKEHEDHKNDRHPTPVTKPTLITEEEARQAALTHANISDVEEIECELELIRGTYIYEIAFEAEGVEYEYTVNAVTGAIIRFHKDVEFEGERPEPKPEPDTDSEIPGTNQKPSHKDELQIPEGEQQPPRKDEVQIPEGEQQRPQKDEAQIPDGKQPTQQEGEHFNPVFHDDHLREDFNQENTHTQLKHE